MSDQKISVKLEKRETVGKGLGKLRRSGQLPAVIHVPGQASIAVVGGYADLYKVYTTAGKHHPVDVKVGDKNMLTIIKDIHFEPKKNRMQHIVFGQIKQNEKVETEVPLRFESGSPAEKAGLLVLSQMDTVEVEALPRELPDEIVVPVESLAAVGDRLTVADLKAAAGVTIISDPEQVVVAVEAQLTAAAEAEATEEATAAETAAAEAAEAPASSESTS